MATAMNANSGIHQLPADCYPVSESDDEDSFVVLNNSLGPDVHMDRVLSINTEPISTNTIEASLDNIADLLTQQSYQEKVKENATVTDAACVSYQSEISADEIQKKVDDLIKENLKLKETLAQNNMAMKKQVETITEWQTAVQRVQESHKEKFIDMKKYIAILKAENDELKNAKKHENQLVNEDVKKTNEILVKQTDNIKQFEFEALQKKVKELEKALDIFSLERECISKALSDKHTELTNTISEKELLAYELELAKQRANNLAKAASEIQLLKDEIVELRDTNNNFRDQIEKLNGVHITLLNCEQELSQKKEQLMISQMHITELKQINAAAISEKDKEIESFRVKANDLQLSADENTALRAQLELYKNDFEMERSQRKELMTEKNKIADDLQHLQRRNNQLLEEVDQLRSGYVPVKKEDVAAAATELYRCPRCAFRFLTYQALENHIYNCLELDTMP